MDVFESKLRTTLPDGDTDLTIKLKTPSASVTVNVPEISLSVASPEPLISPVKIVGEFTKIWISCSVSNPISSIAVIVKEASPYTPVLLI